jgi:hypothetical protein
LWAELATLIHPRRDDVRAWPVAQDAEVELWGTHWPQDIFVGGGGPVALRRLLQARVLEEEGGLGG